MFSQCSKKNVQPMIDSPGHNQQSKLYSCCHITIFMLPYNDMAWLLKIHHVGQLKKSNLTIVLSSIIQISLCILQMLCPVFLNTVSVISLGSGLESTGYQNKYFPCQMTFYNYVYKLKIFSFLYFLNKNITNYPSNYNSTNKNLRNKLYIFILKI